MKHLDLSTIHQFLDGELDDAFLERATAHLSVCDHCTASLLEAEAEIERIDFAFAAEKSIGIPTQRIWARIENEIDVLDRSVAASQSAPQSSSLWSRLFAFLPAGELFSFTPSQIGFAGSFAAILLFSALGVGVLRQQSSSEIADSNSGSAIQNIQTSKPDTKTVVENRSTAAEQLPVRRSEPRNVVLTRNSADSEFQFSKASYKPKPEIAFSKSKPVGLKPVNLNVPLTEEQAYLEAIADLKKTVDLSDASVMRPSFRVQYEQNLAMTDKAIQKMQRQVRRNPRDENARRILLASYQNKIDLLNTVAEKSQLMASLR